MTVSPEDLQHGTTAQEIARQLRADIEAGRYRHQEQLPSTRALAAEWHTSIGTINRVMSQLADDGLVTIRARSSRLVNYPGPDQQERGSTGGSTVVLVGGYAGSGKTELGRILARLTGWAMLDKDSITRPIAETALRQLGQSPHDRESPTYLEYVRPGEYEALREVTVENLSCGNSVIMTAPFLRELSDQAWCQRTEAELHALGAALRVIWVRCDADSMRTYLSRRGAARDAGKLADWDGYLAGLDTEFQPATSDYVIVDNSVSAAPLQAQAEQVLREWGIQMRR